MAFGKRFEASFQSYNKTDYYFCVWVEGYAGATVEMQIGKGGPKLSYETDDDSRFNPILASTLSVPFVVKGAPMEFFVESIRSTYEEKQVWFSLYKNTSATGKPIFNGYVILDLGAREDVSYPYDVTITATDGLALLKDEDFVESTASLPYDSADMYWGPAAFTYWVAQILQKTGQNNTDLATALGVSPSFSTSIDWYNANSGTVGVTNDPFENTRGKMSWTHSQDSQGRFQVMNSYDVLKAIMKAWGCRIVYWNHNFYIVQLALYNTFSTGTLAAPVNIDTRYYSLTGASTVQNLYLGENLNTTRYDLQFDLSSMAGTTPSQGLQKLAGTKYDYYTKVHKVTADFISGGGRNYFNGFPFYDGSATPVDVAQEVTIDINYATNLLLQIPLKAQMDYYGTMRVRIYFDLKATNGVTTKYLKDNGSSAFTWVSSPPSHYPNNEKPSVKYEITGTAPQEVIGFDELIPTDAAFTGQWTFTLQVDSSNWGSPTTSEFVAIDPVGGSFGSSIISVSPSTYSHTWSNVPNPNFGNSVSNQNTQLQYQNTSGNQFEGSFLSINSTFGVNQFGQNVYIETNTSDSDVYRFGELQYGDTLDGTDDAALQTYNGSAWTVTDFAGEWGTGTLAGSKTFTEMLVNDFIAGQTKNIMIINTTTVLSVNDKTDSFGGSDYLKYVNPIGRIFENPYTESPRHYIFRRGVWNFAKDEVEYEGFEVYSGIPTYPTVTTNTDRKYYKGEPIALDSGGPMPRVMQPYDNARISANNVFLSQTTQDITGVNTTLNITEIGVAVFKSGDKISLFDKYGIKSFELTLTADQLYDAVTLSISSFDFGNTTIEKGALISYSKYEVTKNHNVKPSFEISFSWSTTSASIQGNYYRLNGSVSTQSQLMNTSMSTSTSLSPLSAVQSGIFYADADYTLVSGRTVSVMNVAGWTYNLIIAKYTPVDGSFLGLFAANLGTFIIANSGSGSSDIDLIAPGNTISEGDLIVPVLYVDVTGSRYSRHSGVTNLLLEKQ